MVYQWGLYKYAADPNKVGRELEKIEKRDGEITRSAIVEAARPKDSLMHGLFEWNDKIAGEKWREQQAGTILHALVVVPDNPDEPVHRAFMSIEFGNQPGQKARYINAFGALSNEETKDIVLGNAIRELEAFKLKYKTLTELAEIFSAIEQVEIKVKRGAKK